MRLSVLTIRPPDMRYAAVKRRYFQAAAEPPVLPQPTRGHLVKRIHKSYYLPDCVYLDCDGLNCVGSNRIDGRKAAMCSFASSACRFICGLYSQAPLVASWALCELCLLILHAGLASGGTRALHHGFCSRAPRVCSAPDLLRYSHLYVRSGFCAHASPWVSLVYAAFRPVRRLHLRVLSAPHDAISEHFSKETYYLIETYKLFRLFRSLLISKEYRKPTHLMKKSLDLFFQRD